jgi:hypothetical protein
VTNLRRLCKRLGLATCLYASALSAAPVSNADLPESYSDYERVEVSRALEHTGFQYEPEPEGKRVEAIEIITREVFDDRDPVPDFLNVFHATSRRYVIARELLFREGDVYDPVRMQESARNLRALRQLSLVLLVPVRGSRKGRVRVLVITKDVWSLRLNWDVALANSKLQGLVLNPSEQNLFGTHTNIGALFRIRPDTYSTGARFANNRIGGSRLSASVAGNVIWNRETGHSEGSSGYFLFGQPLYSRETKWGFRTAMAWLKETTRSYVGLTPRLYVARPRALGSPACAQDPQCSSALRSGNPGAVGFRIPYVYLTERWLGEAKVVRSFGRVDKYDLSLGAEVDRRYYRPPDLSAYDPRAALAFVQSELPVSDTRISPVVELHAYSSRLGHFVDFETLGLQEDYSIGHEVIWRLYPASRDLGSSRDLLGSYAAASYSVPIGDGLLRAIAGSGIDLAAESRHDALLEMAVRAVTPRLGFGRFVADGLLLNRYRNYLNRRFVLGGDTRLRGYAAGAFLGKDLVAANLEFRSRPIEILSAQVGLDVFYDTGDAFDGFENLKLKQSAGLGLRILFPQLDRGVFRMDWGFPLSPGYSTFPGALFVTFRQAFALPALGSPSIVDSFIEGG